MTLRHEARITLLALAGGLPAVIIALAFLWGTPQRASVRLTLTVLVLGAWLACAVALRGRAVTAMHTLSNMLAALREGDYSIRARGADGRSPLGLAYQEVNALADQLRQQRLDAVEAMGLLRRVMEAIDVAVFTFDDRGRLQLLNRGGEALLGLPPERALGLTAEALGLEDAIAGATPRMLELALPGRAGRLELRRGTFRWEGRPHRLVVLTDLTRSLREEERLAFQRLIRVLSHEINNSLAPIKSIAGSLQSRVSRGGDAAALRADLDEGLGVIASRAETLGRFIQSYARLTRLPRPVPRPVPVALAARRIASLETRMPIELLAGPDVTLQADPDQLDALLINLVRNAADAALETGGGVRVGWSSDRDWVDVRVEDDGPGLADTSNLFVPFFTTKPGGTGIGLALCRQIAEAHGGSVALANRPRSRGGIATVRLPLRGPG
ncbi:MAG TPA: ATP-binding protein, partial [Candidatus Eisenbacteria bacterium]|nr:ATP-binding protein [Candidatus Eisenbacteria bacterium]